MYGLIHTYFNIISNLLWFLCFSSLNELVFSIYSLCKIHTKALLGVKNQGSIIQFNLFYMIMYDLNTSIKNNYFHTYALGCALS